MALGWRLIRIATFEVEVSGPRVCQIQISCGALTLATILLRSPGCLLVQRGLRGPTELDSHSVNVESSALSRR